MIGVLNKDLYRDGLVEIKESKKGVTAGIGAISGS